LGKKIRTSTPPGINGRIIKNKEELSKNNLGHLLVNGTESLLEGSPNKNKKIRREE